MRVSSKQLIADFEAGKKASLARVISIVENHRDDFEDMLATLHPRIGTARRIGLTGPPGAGKSSITSLLVKRYRDAGLKVAVIAVDPTSPFTGGALLGDRVRMESVALDDGVFIRSMATRGSLGGLAATAREVADVLDAFGFDRILMETVGVGQTELDIARAAPRALRAHARRARYVRQARPAAERRDPRACHTRRQAHDSRSRKSHVPNGPARDNQRVGDNIPCRGGMSVRRVETVRQLFDAYRPHARSELR